MAIAIAVLAIEDESSTSHSSATRISNSTVRGGGSLMVCLFVVRFGKVSVITWLVSPKADVQASAISGSASRYAVCS